MRVIAGSAKGVRLGPVPPGVRPMSDRAKEGLFSSLAPELAGARVLDLFAGTGSLGIEALSRGADRAVFVERNRGALIVLRDNLARVRLSERAEVVAADAGGFLSRPTSGGGTPFDLVLADPPYDAAAKEVAALLAGAPGEWLAPGATVALTRGRRSSTPVIPVHWLVSRRLEYGDTAVLIFREA
jgi:16S rRNA (guanine966-N2)-methyltransferase